MYPCAKCGRPSKFACVDLTDFLCLDCTSDFVDWCKAMDRAHIEYHYDEFLMAA